MQMRFNIKKTSGFRSLVAFTLVEVMICLALFALIAAGTIYGYAQSDRAALWSAMSLAAQSYASEGLERVRTATWLTQSSSGTTTDDIPAPTNIYQTNYMEIPSTGKFFSNYPCVVSVSLTSISTNPPLRQILATCTWQFPPTGKTYTNTVVTQRASN